MAGGGEDDGGVVSIVAGVQGQGQRDQRRRSINTHTHPRKNTSGANDQERLLVGARFAVLEDGKGSGLPLVPLHGTAEVARWLPDRLVGQLECPPVHAHRPLRPHLVVDEEGVERV